MTKQELVLIRKCSLGHCPATKNSTEVMLWHYKRRKITPILGALFCEFWDDKEEEEGAGDVGACWECLDGAEDAVKAEVVEERLVCVWSMFQRDWTTDCLSNLSRTEMVHTISSKEWGSTLIMAMTTSSS